MRCEANADDGHGASHRNLQKYRFHTVPFWMRTLSHSQIGARVGKDRDAFTCEKNAALCWYLETITIVGPINTDHVCLGGQWRTNQTLQVYGYPVRTVWKMVRESDFPEGQTPRIAQPAWQPGATILGLSVGPGFRRARLSISLLRADSLRLRGGDRAASLNILCQ